ncbi:hypothetical protein Dimus_008132 [Dionaea muscipula]
MTTRQGRRQMRADLAGDDDDGGRSGGQQRRRGDSYTMKQREAGDEAEPRGLRCQHASRRRGWRCSACRSDEEELYLSRFGWNRTDRDLSPAMARPGEAMWCQAGRRLGA